MTFANPILAAVGLGCVAIPIIIHILMRRRRRPVAWGAMRFLIEAYRRQRRRMNLEQLLLLGCRCLLVALLAAALGKPLLDAAGGTGAGGARTVYLLIDTGLASGVAEPGAADGPTELDRSKTAARELLDGLDGARGDRAALIALGTPADALILPPTVDLAAVASALRDLRPTAGRSDVAGALGLVRDDLGRAAGAGTTAARATVALLGGLRAGSADTGSTLPTLEGVGAVTLAVLTPADAPLDNVSVASIDPLRAVLVARETGGDAVAGVAARVTLRRSGPGVAAAGVSNLFLRVAPEGGGRAPRAEVAVAWSPGQETASTVLSADLPPRELAAGRRAVVLEASIDADALAVDNIARRPVERRDRLEVGLLAPGPVGGKATIDQYTAADWLALALTPDADPALRRRQGGDLRVTVVDPARGLSGPRAGVLADFDALLIPRPDLLDPAAWRLVRAAVDRGALVVVMPPAAETHLWSDAMTQALGLGWTLSREPRTLTPAEGLAAGAADADLLAILAPELPELAKPVTVSRLLTVESPPGGFDTLLSLTDGSPLVITGRPGEVPSARDDAPAVSSRGIVVLFTAPTDLGWTDLPTKPLMLPLVQEIVRQGIGRSMGPLVGVAGTTPPLPAGASELVRAVIEPASGDSPGAGDGAAAVQVDAAGHPATPLRHAGLWTVRGDAGTTIGVLAVNADSEAGRTDLRTKDDIARWLEPVAGTVAWLDGGAPSGPRGTALPTPDARSPWSWPLLIAAAALALAEIALARWFSHARADAPLGVGTAPAAAGSRAA